MQTSNNVQLNNQINGQNVYKLDKYILRQNTT